MSYAPAVLPLCRQLCGPVFDGNNRYERGFPWICTRPLRSFRWTDGPGYDLPRSLRSLLALTLTSDPGLCKISPILSGPGSLSEQGGPHRRGGISSLTNVTAKLIAPVNILEKNYLGWLHRSTAVTVWHYFVDTHIMRMIWSSKDSSLFLTLKKTLPPKQLKVS